MMKDKLEKTGHRRPYHAMRRLGLWGFAFLCLVGVSSIPVGISYRMAEEAAAQISEHGSGEGETSLASEIQLAGEHL